MTLILTSGRMGLRRATRDDHSGIERLQSSRYSSVERDSQAVQGEVAMVPVRKIITGVPEDQVLNRGSLANPECLATPLAAAPGTE